MGTKTDRRALAIVTEENERLRDIAGRLQKQWLSAQMALLGVLAEHGGFVTVGKETKERVEREFATLGWRIDPGQMNPDTSIVSLVAPEPAK